MLGIGEHVRVIAGKYTGLMGVIKAIGTATFHPYAVFIDFDIEADGEAWVPEQNVVST